MGLEDLRSKLTKKQSGISNAKNISGKIYSCPPLEQVLTCVSNQREIVRGFLGNMFNMPFKEEQKWLKYLEYICVIGPEKLGKYDVLVNSEDAKYIIGCVQQWVLWLYFAHYNIKCCNLLEDEFGFTSLIHQIAMSTRGIESYPTNNGISIKKLCDIHFVGPKRARELMSLLQNMGVIDDRYKVADYSDNYGFTCLFRADQIDSIQKIASHVCSGRLPYFSDGDIGIVDPLLAFDDRLFEREELSSFIGMLDTRKELESILIKTYGNPNGLQGGVVSFLENCGFFDCMTLISYIKSVVWSGYMGPVSMDTLRGYYDIERDPHEPGGLFEKMSFNSVIDFLVDVGILERISHRSNEFNCADYDSVNDWYKAMSVMTGSELPHVKKGGSNAIDSIRGTKDMSGVEFENYCKIILSKNGFINIQETSVSGDHGVDLIAYKVQFTRDYTG